MPTSKSNSKSADTATQDRRPKSTTSLERVLKERGLSAQDLAIMVKSERSTVFRWITGQRIPETKYWTKIQKALEIDREELGRLVFLAKDGR